ncbi:MAG TPA: META domain-containing protein [Ferruginibacter sp.]|nr:META domain-containing protein [Ferruginibacter sp.]
MKKYFTIAIIAVISTFASCDNSKKTTEANNTTNMKASEITNKKWQLIELSGKSIAQTINGKMPFIQFNNTDNRYTASAGCNGLGGTFTISTNGRIKFTQGMSTMMACEQMEIENDFKKMLGLADNYTVHENILSLNKARMAPLARFKEVKYDATQTLNGTWELDYISGARIAFEGLYPDKKPTITFNLPETKATGNGSCNNFNVAFTMHGNNIKFNMPAATRMACPGNGEASFFETLQKISSYSVSNNTLNLIMGDIAMMRFQKK